MLESELNDLIDEFNVYVAAAIAGAWSYDADFDKIVAIISSEEKKDNKLRSVRDKLLDSKAGSLESMSDREWEILKGLLVARAARLWIKYRNGQKQ